MCPHAQSCGRSAARVTYALPRADTSARWARYLTARYLAQSCGGTLSADRIDDARLVVSELVTNATVHGRGDCLLRLTARPGRLTVEVHDSSPARPKVYEPPRRSTPPRGVRGPRDGAAPACPGHEWPAARGEAEQQETGTPEPEPVESFASLDKLPEGGRGMAMVRGLTCHLSVLGDYPGGGKTVQAVLAG
jgi:Histidine kinase-like ATPase domain